MNVLAIGAHFDDIELGCGGSLAAHSFRGDNVYAFVASTSGFSGTDPTCSRSDSIARSEGERAIQLLGVKSLSCGEIPTLHVEFVDELNIQIIQLVQKYNIDLVYTHWVGDVHHDHQAVAKASLHSCRHVPSLLMYRSNWYHSSLDFKGTFYRDISLHWETKKKAIACHQSEMQRTGRKWISFFENEALNAGQRIGVKYAEVFEVVKFLA